MAIRRHETGGKKDTFPTGTELEVQSGATLDHQSGATLNLHGESLSQAEVAILNGATVSTAELNLSAGRTTTAAQLEQLNTDPVAGALGGAALLVFSRVVTISEINAGHVLIAALAGRTITVHGFRCLVLGGNFAAATSVEIEDTQGTPVIVVKWDNTVAALTDNAVVSNGLVIGDQTDNTPLSLTADKGISINKTGSDVTTADSLTVTIWYSVVDA